MLLQSSIRYVECPGQFVSLVGWRIAGRVRDLLESSDGVSSSAPVSAAMPAMARAIGIAPVTLGSGRWTSYTLRSQDDPASVEKGAAQHIQT